MKAERIITVLLVCCALFAAAGCKQKAPGISDIQATSGDRHIHVLIEGGAFVEPGEDKFTVKLPGHELVIGKEQVLLDKKAAAKVPADAKRFVVILKSGALTVSADGAEIFKAPPGK